jgi:hypothetical protein
MLMHCSRKRREHDQETNIGAVPGGQLVPGTSYESSEIVRNFDAFDLVVEKMKTQEFGGEGRKRKRILCGP